MVKCYLHCMFHPSRLFRPSTTPESKRLLSPLMSLLSNPSWLVFTLQWLDNFSLAWVGVCWAVLYFPLDSSPSVSPAQSFLPETPSFLLPVCLAVMSRPNPCSGIGWSRGVSTFLDASHGPLCWDIVRMPSLISVRLTLLLPWLSKRMGNPGWVPFSRALAPTLWCVSEYGKPATCTQEMAGKILALWFPVAGFVIMGFDHCIADQFLVPMGMMLGADVSIFDLIFGILAPAMLGIIVGGGIFVGAIYWYVFDSMESFNAMRVRI